MTNMAQEIIDAVLETYKGADEEIATDCLLYLASLKVLPLGYMAYRELEKMGRCTQCGRKLSVYTYREAHLELEGCPYEYLETVYCPQCDIKDHKY